MLLQISFFLCIICCSQKILEAKCDDYYCTSDPWKCILKGFESVEEIDEFCNRRSVFEYTDINGNINTASGSQFQIIEFQNVTMTRLPSACFTKFTSISELYANNTGIKLIKDDDFQNIRYLQILNLSGNKIDTFENSSFQYLGNLRKIDLSYNNIEKVPIEIFEGMPQSVTVINLNHDQISQFDEQILLRIFKIDQLQKFHDRETNTKISILLSYNKINEFLSTVNKCKLNYNGKRLLELNLSNNFL
ncbi:hypothetical protein PVAND_000680 [Polypedilum vanderplanki]|uniref:Leucine rich repeat protein n=1 Tax=Polypedilum vanderplanki TaxID=319348 RepID=A0A9J6BKW9_POLVA|nr:hypothetical protein PVAND_000680 [Polypedilum vanderplanki]